MHFKKIAAAVLVAALVSTPITSFPTPNIAAEEAVTTDLGACSMQLAAAGPFDPATDFAGLVSVYDANGNAISCDQYSVSWNVDSQAGVAVITASALDGSLCTGSVQCTASVIIQTILNRKVFL